MDPAVPTSFIPKKPLVGDSRVGGVSGIAVLLSMLLFVASLLAAGSAYGYGRYLESAIADKDASLKKAEGAFDTRSIQDLQRLDTRLTEAQTLLDKHVAPSGLFTFLSATTLERVQFTSLNVTIGSDGAGAISMSGIADSFSTLALQSDEFSHAQALRDVIFSGITTDATGRVVFSVTAKVDPSLLNYAKQNTLIPTQ
jgi:Tfp pilus assembly protein PilN